MPLSQPSYRYRQISCPVCRLQSTEHIQVVQAGVKHRGRFQGDPIRVVACVCCGLVFINPQPLASEYAAFYETEYYQLNWPSDPEQIRQNVELLNNETRHYLNRFFTEKHLSDLTGKRNPAVLDVGAGYGAGIEFLLERQLTTPNQLAALEPSREAAASLRKQYGIEVHEALLEQNTLPSERFDFVISLALIEHLGNPLEGIHAFWRLLQPGGHLLLATPSLDAQILERRGLDWFKIVHPFYFSQASLTRLLQAGGFSVISSEIQHSLAGDYNMMVVAAQKQPVVPDAIRLFQNPASLAQVRSEIDTLQAHIQSFSASFPEKWVPFQPLQKKRKTGTLVNWMRSLVSPLGQRG